ncbi:PREDICTED: putative ribonuclease H protein At1g65750-like [Fragaria vesca subsp. vesca]
MFSWCKPPENFYKLNIDGSRSSSFGCIGAGGVLRDHLGIWIDGFQVNLGTSEVLDAEAWGLFFGLRMVAMHNIVNLEIESNYAVLVQLMLKSDTGVHPLGSLLDSCSVMMSKLLNVNIKHIFRECNMVADALAKNSINHDLGLISFDVVPAHAIQAVLDDLAGVTRARRTGCCSSL